MSGWTGVRALIVVFPLAWVAVITAAHSQPPTSDTGGTYVGSATCQRCHQTQYATWRRSLHQQMIRPIDQASVAGDFNGESTTQHGRTYTMNAAAGGYAVAVSHGDAASETFDVNYTLGAKRLQGYLSPLPDGRLYVLPVFWHVEWRRWLDWKEIAPVPDSHTDLRQIWNVNCFNCHATNIQRNFDPDTGAFATSATEMGIGCEACHGPGRAHVDLTTRWEQNPASGLRLDLSRTNRHLSAELRIFTARTDDSRAVYDACAYCHGNKTNYFTGFVPGNRLEDFAQFALISDPISAGDPQGEFWPDGRPSRFNRPQALTLSGCFRAGQIACTTCHVAHGSDYEHSLQVPTEDTNSLCTQCHRSLDGPEGSQHAHHAAGSPGSRCIACHMSDVNWRLLTRRRDHTFAPPVPEMTARYGVPNACTTCHDDRTPEWAASIMNGWYGDAGRRQTTMRIADAIYGAGSSLSSEPRGSDAKETDRTIVAELERLVGDRRQGALLRASAAGFLGRLPAPPGPGELAAHSHLTVAALTGAAVDPEPMVRIAAVRSLGAVGDNQATSALVARLGDDARVVRVSAAEALLYMGVVHLDGSAGVALEQAQEGYAVSLRAFPDLASHQASLGWLLASQGKTAQAGRVLQRARMLDANDPRPRVYLGVLAARAGWFDEAIAEWRAARQINPRYPNLDRLIAEATARTK